MHFLQTHYGVDLTTTIFGHIHSTSLNNHISTPECPLVAHEITRPFKRSMTHCPLYEQHKAFYSTLSEKNCFSDFVKLFLVE